MKKILKILIVYNSNFSLNFLASNGFLELSDNIKTLTKIDYVLKNNGKKEKSDKFEKRNGNSLIKKLQTKIWKERQAWIFHFLNFDFYLNKKKTFLSFDRKFNFLQDIFIYWFQKVNKLTPFDTKWKFCPKINRFFYSAWDHFYCSQ